MLRWNGTSNNARRRLQRPSGKSCAPRKSHSVSPSSQDGGDDRRKSQVESISSTSVASTHRSLHNGLALRKGEPVRYVGCVLRPSHLWCCVPCHYCRTNSQDHRSALWSRTDDRVWCPDAGRSFLFPRSGRGL